MSLNDKPKFEGKIESAKGNGFFSVDIDLENGNTKLVICTLSGKMRTNNIKVVSGDYVDVELDPYDMNKGRIVYRRKNNGK